MSLSSSTPAPMIRPKTSILDKSLSRGKQEVSLSAYALLFSEIVQYCQSRSNTVPELQEKLHDFGWQARIEQRIFFLFLNLLFALEKTTCFFENLASTLPAILACSI